MSTALLILEVITYSLALWLGLYLISRNPASLRLWLTGLGLIAYALSLAGDLLTGHAPSPALATTLARLHWPLLFLPPIFWFGATLYLLPESTSASRLRQMLLYLLLPASIPFYLFSAGTNLVFDFSGDLPQAGPAYLLFATIELLPVLAALVIAGYLYRAATPKKPLGLLLMVSIFFGLSAGLLIFPLNWLPRPWLLLTINLDFILLGLVIALLDALEEGEVLLPDFFRSLTAAAFAALIFGGMVTVTMAAGPAVTFPMLALLLATIAVAIFTQTFSDPLQSALDALALAAFPGIRQARAELRTAASTLPRVNESLNLPQLDEAEFARLTRRALSHMGNLPRLATSPLTRLPLVDTRLAQRKAKDNTLERAAELKAILTESIARLKPRQNGEFGTAEAWRFYNALYFPYVAGLKPYSRRHNHNHLSPAEKEALDWFRTYVPERTLYNWQTAAAKLVAKDLRDRLKNNLSSSNHP